MEKSLSESAENDGKSENAVIAPESRPEAGSFRVILPQILATTAKNLLIIDIGLAFAFPTIVIPVLRGLQADRFPDEPMHFTAEQVSWYSSLGFVGQPIGSLLSGWVTEPIGRKRAMILVNIPHVCAWSLMYAATSPLQIYIAVVLIGLGIGLMEAPILTYVGEIAQPSIRGILLSCTMAAATLGFLIVYVLGTLVAWRQAALVCLAVPLFSMLAICFVPETPHWLLSKGRTDDALRALRWLRGWVSERAVADEFAQLQRSMSLSQACEECKRLERAGCQHTTEGGGGEAHWRIVLREMRQRATLRPFILMLAALAVISFGGVSTTRLYLVQIFQTFAIPMDPNLATVVMALANISANVLCMCGLRLVGKRALYLFSAVGSLASSFAIAGIAYSILPAGYSSFDVHAEALPQSTANTVVMYMFFSVTFFANLGIYPVTFTLISEIFPFRTRGVASGVVLAISYLFSFISAKCFLLMDRSLSLAGTFCVYGSVLLLGFLVMYVFLPETEDRTLEEVEQYFSDRNRRLTDRHVPRAPKRKRSLDGVENIAMQA